MRRVLLALPMRFAVPLALLTGCSMDPRFVRPEGAVPAQWPTGAAYAPATVEPALPPQAYRAMFRDPALQAVIAQGLERNGDLAEALAHVAAARAAARIERARLFPEVAVSGAAETVDVGSDGRGSRTDYTVGAGLSRFEIDLFGRQRSLGRAAFHDYLATEAGARAVRLSLVAEIADTWLRLAADRTLLAIAVDTEANAERSVALTRARLEGGIAPRSDLSQAETVRAEARADRADLTTLVAQDRNALELLAGGPVDEALLPAGIAGSETMLALLPAGLDSRILLQRPDVVEAEERLRAANARIGAARAAFFPVISLTTVAGFSSSALSALFERDASGWTVTPEASLTLFDGGVRSGGLRGAKAGRDAAVAHYRQVIRAAFRDVADALARQGTIAAQLAAAVDREAAAATSESLAAARYREGIDPYLQSLAAQRGLYDARRALARTQLAQAANRVAVYRALGGDMVEPAGR